MSAIVMIPTLNERENLTELTQRLQSLSLAQLTILYDTTGDQGHLVQAQLYSYRSLMVFRLLPELPLAYREGLRIIPALQSDLVIAVIQHEDHCSPDKYCVLRRGRDGAPDYLEILYRPSREEVRRQESAEKVVVQSLHPLGCWPMRGYTTGTVLASTTATSFP